MEFSRPEYWGGSRSLLQGIFPIQGLNPGLPHCRLVNKPIRKSQWLGRVEGLFLITQNPT